MLNDKIKNKILNTKITKAKKKKRVSNMEGEKKWRCEIEKEKNSKTILNRKRN